MSETLATHILLRAFADELARCGVAGACTSPGSRSTPLVLALVREAGLPCWSHIDERCAAFFGLGVAKATGRPVVLACTSGTAAANYLPAVIEAHEARVPLIILTTDRPPELRGSGAGQTIDQLKLYGDAVKWFCEVGTHGSAPERLAWMRRLACRAVWTTLDGRPGAVHLNFPLREPLILDDELPPPEQDPVQPRADGRPWVARMAPGPGPGAHDAAQALEPIVRSASNGVIVAGRHERRQWPLGPAAASFAAAAGWPLLADPLSGARGGAHAVAHYDALLRVAPFARAASPDVVVRVGDLPTSKPLRQWLHAADAVQVVIDVEDAWQDPDCDAELLLAADPAATLAAAAALLGPGPATPAAPLSGWLRADDMAASALATTLGDTLNEPRVAAELGARLPADATLVVAASMPIRDIETFAGARLDSPRVLSNRGANGIDGTVSTAFGIAAGSVGPVVLLCGDVTLAHDLGGLLAARRLRLPLTIVLIDNAGGGIFDFLAVSTQVDAFEEHIATPTGLDAERIAALFDLVYAPAPDLAAFRRALQHGLASEEVTLIHVKTERPANVALHRRCWDAVAAALTAG